MTAVATTRETRRQLPLWSETLRVACLSAGVQVGEAAHGTVSPMPNSQCPKTPSPCGWSFL
ncbi:hypothetical protein FDUTEX481_03116 [Tolypothrix sp. PCC 7601]|nr:hypothetical protein FDUTEX481_03116 [Tolypothrix sp. PCC 7601]